MSWFAPRAASSTPAWNFFDVPRLSRADQSLRIYGEKFVRGWPLIRRHWPKLLRRFMPRLTG
jgi:hypothetical protein